VIAGVVRGEVRGVVGGLIRGSLVELVGRLYRGLLEGVIGWLVRELIGGLIRASIAGLVGELVRGLDERLFRVSFGGSLGGRFEGCLHPHQRVDDRVRLAASCCLKTLGYWILLEAVMCEMRQKLLSHWQSLTWRTEVESW
jgi:hypothetical protein